jgi:guanylate kinase
MQKVLGIIGPSGAGKSTIITTLSKKLPLTIIPTWTDRPRRLNEQELEHKFVDSRTFSELANKGYFAEVVQPFSLPYRYGIVSPNTAVPKGTIPVLMFRAEFMQLFQKYYKNFIIYQIEADFSSTNERIRLRGKTEIGSRQKYCQPSL